MCRQTTAKFAKCGHKAQSLTVCGRGNSFPGYPPQPCSSRDGTYAQSEAHCYGCYMTLVYQNGDFGKKGEPYYKSLPRVMPFSYVVLGIIPRGHKDPACWPMCEFMDVHLEGWGTDHLADMLSRMRVYAEEELSVHSIIPGLPAPVIRKTTESWPEKKATVSSAPQKKANSLKPQAKNQTATSSIPKKSTTSSAPNKKSMPSVPEKNAKGSASRNQDIVSTSQRRPHTAPKPAGRLGDGRLAPTKSYKTTRAEMKDQRTTTQVSKKSSEKLSTTPLRMSSQNSAMPTNPRPSSSGKSPLRLPRGTRSTASEKNPRPKLQQPDTKKCGKTKRVSFVPAAEVQYFKKDAAPRAVKRNRGAGGLSCDFELTKNCRETAVGRVNGWGRKRGVPGRWGVVVRETG